MTARDKLPKKYSQRRSPDFSDPTIMTQSPPHSSQDENVEQSIAKGGVTTPFPWKLHDMLDDMAKKGDSSVVTWQPHGRAFMVHKPQVFVSEIMRKYFNQTKYASFQRQLNLYGFSRLSHGQDKGAYFHHCFIRGQRALCRNMVRQKIKGTKVRRSLSAEEEPNFYAPEFQSPSTPSPALSTCTVTVRKENPLATTTSRSRTPSKSRQKKSKAQPQPPQGPAAISLVSIMKSNVSAAPSSLPVIPSPPLIKPRQVPSISQAYPQAIAPAARGGDLLYFEGRPFRYLEHIEELPPTPLSQPYSALHDMITSIVNMEKKSSWATQGGMGLIQSN